VTCRPRPARPGLATLAVVIGLLGACAVLVVLADAPGRTGATAARGDRIAPAPRPRPPATPAQAAGLRLMAEAVTACQTVAFTGTQVDSWPGDAGAAAAAVLVWHQPGQAMLAQYAARPAAGQPGGASAAPPDQADVLTITAPLLALMREHYVLADAGPGQAGGRPARVIEVRHPGGGLAARYWLDQATGLPLRRVRYGPGGAIFSEVAFAQLSLGPGEPGTAPAALASPWPGRLDAGRRAALRAAGWPLPDGPPAGLSLLAATQTGTGASRVVELSYSDGLSVVSVFVQRGQLPARLPGWRAVPARGHEVYAIDSDDQSLAWSAGGYVVTVIADAPAGTVNQAVTALSAARGPGPAPGFWPRMGRGFRRLLSWANPLR
jgi:sigma-E factor negative regulatory protein RseB